MADTGTIFPNLEDYLPQNQPQGAMPAPAAKGVTAPEPTGTSGFFGSALKGGAYEALGQAGDAGQAAARALGFNDAADKAAAWAMTQRTNAAAVENPEYEKMSAWNPEGLAYKVLKGMPASLPIAAGALAAPELGGSALLAGAALSYPFAVGGNVQASEATRGELGQGAALASLGLGVPEAAIGAMPLGRIADIAARGPTGSIMRSMTSAGGVAAVAGGAQDLIGQAMGDPDRPIADRAKEVLENVLTGGATGAIFGAGAHGIAKLRPEAVSKDQMGAAIDTDLGRTPKTAAPEPEAPAPETQPETPAEPQPAPPPQAAQSQPLPEAIAPAPEPPIDTPLAGQAPAPGDIAQPAPPIADQIRDATGGKMPAWMNGIDDPAAARAAIRAKWEATGPNKMVRALADKFDMRDENGDLKPTPVEDIPNRPEKEDVPAAHQDRWQEIEDTRPQLKDPAHIQAADDAQSALLAPKQGETAQIDKTIDSLKSVIEGNKADADIAVKKAGTVVDTPKNKAPDDPAIVGAPLSPDAEAPDGGDNEPGTETDRFTETRKSLGKAQASLDKLTGLDVAGAARNARGEPLSDRGAKIVQNIWDRGVDQQQNKLSTISHALDTDNAESMASLGPGHFQSPLWDEHFDRFNAQGQRLMSEHAENEQDVLDNLHQELGLSKSFFGRGTEATPSTPRDAAITDVLNQGGSTKDVMQDIARNGSAGWIKTMGNLMAQKGVDAPVRFADRALHTKRFPGVNGEDGYGPAYANYSEVGNKIYLYEPTNLEQAMLHEAAHAGTARGIEANTPAAKEMDGLYNHFKANSPDQGAYGLNNTHEFVAEAFSNPTFRGQLASMPAPEGNKSMWQGFKDAVAKVFGVQGSKATMLDKVIETSSRLMDENKTAPPITKPISSPMDVEARIQPFFGKLNDLRDRAAQLPAEAVTNAEPSVRKGLFGLMTSLGIDKWYGDRAPSLNHFNEALGTRDLLNDLNNKSAGASQQKLRALTDDDKEKIKQMALGTMYGLDGRQAFPKELLNDKNAPALIKAHNELKSTWGRMTPAGQDAYNTLISAQRADILHAQSTLLHTLLSGDYKNEAPLPAGWDPEKIYQFRPELHDSPQMNEKYWGDVHKFMAVAANKYIDAHDVARTAEDGETDKGVELLRSTLSEHAGFMSELDKVPNFPMGRDGGHFAAGKFAVDETGAIPTKNVEALQKMLNAKGFGHLTVDANLKNPQVYSRVDTPSQRENLAGVFHKAEEQGIFEKGSTSDGVVGSLPVGMTSKGTQRVLEIMRANLAQLGEDASPEARGLLEAQAGEMKRQMIDLLPPSSMNKIMVRREGVQGFNGDMLENVRQRQVATARALSNLSSSQHIADAVVSMKNELRALNQDPNVPSSQKTAIHQAMQELLLREAQRTIAQPGAPLQAFREMTHVMEVGASPGYVTMLASQNLTLSLPRLASQAGVGYLKGAKFMAANATKAFDVMHTVWGSADGLSFGMRKSALDTNTRLNQGEKDFLMHQDAMGSFAHAAHTRAMRSEYGDPDSTFGKGRQMASAMGLYSEMQPRVLMAFAARDAWNKSPQLQKQFADVNDFAHKMIVDSQFDWNPTFNARQTTKQGFAGPLSPLLNQFMGFSTRMTEMLYREGAKAIGRDGPDEAAAARKFLAGHLAAVTVLAGSLGLPMAGVFASVFDRLADWTTNQDDWDVTSQYRNWLVGAFGGNKEMAEVFARGVPRAFGVDLDHLGDERIAPGSTALLMLTEKRKIEDAERDWLKAEAGSAAGMVMNWGLAARDMSNGDYLRGMQKMLPDIMRGPVEAAQLGMYGWRDKSGAPMPINPNNPGVASTHDIALTALGLDPQDEAEYNEGKKTISGEQTLAQLRSANITQHLALAMQRGDDANMGYWEDQSEKYGDDHPGQMPPMMDLMRYMRRNYLNAAYATSMGMPLGTNRRNLTGRGMVDYMDLQDQ